MSVPRAPHASMSNGVTAEPSPIDSSSTPRRTPSARPIKRGGTTCCSELYTPTSSKTLATPISPNIRYGQYGAWANASKIIGTPHPATPAAKLRATLLPRTSTIASGTDEETSHAEHRGKPADGGRAQVEQLQVDDYRKDVEVPAGERLGGSGDE